MIIKRKPSRLPKRYAIKVQGDDWTVLESDIPCKVGEGKVIAEKCSLKQTQKLLGVRNRRIVLWMKSMFRV
jgi:hypothetical protein